MELPKVLESLLDTLLRDNHLTSWQIFDEKSNNVVVKLRFGPGHFDQAIPGSHRAAYRRKAPSQMKRDEQRLAIHKQKANNEPIVHNLETTPTPPSVTEGQTKCQRVTRSRIRNTPAEQVRDDSYIQEHQYDISIMSMASDPQVDESLLSMPSVSTPVMAGPVRVERDCITPATGSDACHAKQIHVPDESELHYMDSSEEDEQPEENRCSCTLCEYGPGDKDGTCRGPHYLCTKHTDMCGGEWWMCDLCKSDGFDRAHRKHMTLRTDKICEPLSNFI